jgi:protein-tyrosine-phosphatase
VVVVEGKVLSQTRMRVIACFPEMLLAEVRLIGVYVLSLCPECGDRVVVWNVRDPYFMDREDAWKVYEQIREKVAEQAKSP